LFGAGLTPSDAIADRDDGLHHDGGAGLVTANGLGGAKIIYDFTRTP